MNNISYKQIALALANMPAGSGWRKTIPGLSINTLRADTGDPLTSLTTPAIGITSLQTLVTLASGAERTVFATFEVPREYDECRAGLDDAGRPNEFVVQMKIGMASAVAPTVTLTAVAQPPEGAVKTGYSAGAQTGEAQTACQTLSWDLRAIEDSAGVRLKPGDTVTLKFVLTSAAANALVYDVGGFMTQGPNFTDIEARQSDYATEQPE